jgi:hypothetical protein
MSNFLVLLDERLALALEQAQERLGHLRIELRARVLVDLGHDRLERERLAVGAIARHRLDRVGDEDDPARQRDLVAAQPVGVAAVGAVEPLVVVAHARRHVAQELDRLEDLVARSRDAA